MHEPPFPLSEELEIAVYCDYLEERSDPMHRSLRFYRPNRHDDSGYARSMRVWRRPLVWGVNTGGKNSNWVLSLDLFARLRAPSAVVTTRSGVEQIAAHMREYDDLESAMRDFIHAWRSLYGN